MILLKSLKKAGNNQKERSLVLTGNMIAAAPGRSKHIHWLFEPALFSLLENRVLSAVLAGVGVFQAACALLGAQGWICPVKAVLHAPCPGCGLSAATALLLTGRFQEAVQVHAFAPMFLAGWLMLAVSAVCPDKMRHAVAQRVKKIETHTGSSGLLLVSLLLYWAVRLLTGLHHA